MYSYAAANYKKSTTFSLTKEEVNKSWQRYLDLRIKYCITKVLCNTRRIEDRNISVIIPYNGSMRYEKRRWVVDWKSQFLCPWQMLAEHSNVPSVASACIAKLGMPDVHVAQLRDGFYNRAYVHRGDDLANLFKISQYLRLSIVYSHPDRYVSQGMYCYSLPLSWKSYILTERHRILGVDQRN